MWGRGGEERVGEVWGEGGEKRGVGGKVKEKWTSVVLLWKGYLYEDGVKGREKREGREMVLTCVGKL